MIQIPGVEITRMQFAPAITNADGTCNCDDHAESAWVDGPLTVGCREVLNIPDASCICILATPDSV